MKKSNPNVPFLVREAAGTPARVFARFGECRAHGRLFLIWFAADTCPFVERGVEKHAELDGLSAADVEKKMADLISGR